MKLKLSVDRGQGTFIDFQITADATATVSDIADALISASPIGSTDEKQSSENETEPEKPGTFTLKIVPTPNKKLSSTFKSGRVLSPSTNLINSGIRSGLSVQVVKIPKDSNQVKTNSAGRLRVIEGPAQGEEFPLFFGSQTIGRTGKCDIFVEDESVSKMHASIVMSGIVEIMDHNSANGVFVGNHRVTRATIGPRDVIRLGDTVFTIEQHSKPSLEDATTTDLSFIASPQLIVRPEETEYELPTPPSEPTKARFPIVSLVGPVIMGVAMFLMTRSPMSLVFVGLSPILMLGNFYDQKVQATKELKATLDKVTHQIKLANRELTEQTETIRKNLLHTYPPVEQAWDSALNQGPFLWWRRPENPEFLQVRLGLGTIPTPLKLSEVKKDGMPQFVDAITQLRRQFETIPNAPVVANLRVHGNLGFCGESRLTEEVFLATVVQLICMHSPAHVTIAAFINKTRLHHWEWLQWLPHTDNPHSPIGENLLAHDGMSSQLLIDKLELLVEERLEQPESDLKPTSKNFRGPLTKEVKPDTPHGSEIIVIVDNPTVDMSRLIRLTEIGPEVGIHFIWQARNPNDLPAACRMYMYVDTTGCTVVDVRKGTVIQPVMAEAMKVEQADQVARVLAPVVDGGTPVKDDSDLPTSLSTITLLGKEVADDPDAVITRWRSSNSIIDRTGSIVPLKRAISLNGLVGHNGREYFGLDIREHGPHALIGGTTGSGKSEFLQTWILGMAANVSPDRLTFLFMDYKGGAAFGRCEELPHSVGLVTDLTNNILLRAARSLKAELVRREELLQQHEFNDLTSFEKSGHPDAPPSLLLVIDEFAALKAQFEDFMKDIVDIGQRGRSLGVHLIMATQRPAGVITENLKANTNLRIALRMNDDSDSMDVIGDKQAASIHPQNPGRGAARLGPSRIITFQSGYPGAITPDEASIPPVNITPLGFGVNEPWQVKRRAMDLSGHDKDINRIITNLNVASEKAGIPKPRAPWLPALQDTYNLLDLGQHSDTRLIIGMADYPDLQKQELVYFEPEERAHIAFFGSSGSGKTTALRTLAVAASITSSTGPVHIYGLDFGGGGLGVLDQLPNVGHILDGNEEERIQRLFIWLGEELEQRATLFSKVMASSLSDYRKITDKREFPRILILLDNSIAFHEQYDLSDTIRIVPKIFRKILMEGHSYGVHVAMAGPKPGVPLSLLSYIQRQVILRQSSPDEYQQYNVPKDVLSDASPPGRSVMRIDGYELQLCHVGMPERMKPKETGKPKPAVAPTMAELAVLIRSIAQDRPPVSLEFPVKRIQILESVIPASTIPWSVGNQLVMGIASRTLEPTLASFHEPIFLLGSKGSGRMQALRYLARAAKSLERNMELIYFSTKPVDFGPLSKIWNLDVMSPSGFDSAYAQLEPRFNLPASEALTCAVFIDNILSFEGTPMETKIISIIKKMRENGHLLVITEDLGNLQKSYNTVATVLKPYRSVMHLQGDSESLQTLVNAGVLPRIKRITEPGRGIWYYEGQVQTVQMPLLDEDTYA